MKWTDETSYIQGDKKRVPRSWSLYLSWIIIRVHRHIDYEPDQWLFSTAQLGLDNHELSSKDVQAAQVEALALATARCEDYLRSLKGAVPS